MTAFLAMLLDAYRELNAKKLFWITLAISGLVVVTYASIGFDDEGMSMFFGLTHVESEFLTKGSPMATLLYRSIFSSFIVGLWLAWVATILALISTTTIFPDFLASGSIDLVLSKPLGRVRLFLIKYLGSLLFVFLQVGIFCVGVFICMGWRVGEWNPLIFAAIPLVTVFFSFLYCVNVLVGVLTRSALTALLVTMLFWFSLFSINTADAILTQFHTQFTIEAERARADADKLSAKLAELPDDETSGPARTRIEAQIESQHEQAEEQEEAVSKLGAWRGPIRIVQTIIPKTGETIALLDRWLKEEGDVNLLDLLSGNLDTNEAGEFVPRDQNLDREVAIRMQEEYEARSYTYVLGTSLLFEAVVLGLACLVFVKRDF